MKKILLGCLILITSQSFAKVDKSSTLGCQLYTGENKVFKDLRKFNISSADESGVRVLDAYLAKKVGVAGVCLELDNGKSLECSITNSDGKDLEVVIALDKKRGNEVEGTVFYDGFFDKEHELSCDILDL